MPGPILPRTWPVLVLAIVFGLAAASAAGGLGFTRAAAWLGAVRAAHLFAMRIVGEVHRFFFFFFFFFCRGVDPGF